MGVSKKQRKERSLFMFLVCLAAMILLGCKGSQKSAEEIIPPETEKIPKELTIHGDTRIDNYFWINQRDNPKVIDYLKAENAYKDAVLKHTEKLQKKLPIILYGKQFWNQILNLNALVKWGVISPEDLDLIHLTDDVKDAVRVITRSLGFGSRITR